MAFFPEIGKDFIFLIRLPCLLTAPIPGSIINEDDCVSLSTPREPGLYEIEVGQISKSR
jgi:hypothetical protein